MSDLLGLSEGAKGLSSGLDSARSASKSVTKSIEGIQNDGLEAVSYTHLTLPTILRV